MHSDQTLDDFQRVFPLLLIRIVECIVIDLLRKATQDNSILVSTYDLDWKDETIHLVLDQDDLLVELRLAWLHNIRGHRILLVRFVDLLYGLFVYLGVVWYGVA